MIPRLDLMLLAADVRHCRERLQHMADTAYAERLWLLARVHEMEREREKRGETR